MKTSLLRPLLSCVLIGITVAVHAAQTNPSPLETPSPGYPAALIDTGISGTATIDVLVKADGSVADPKVRSSDHDAFGEAALGAVAKWRFTPATVDGAAIDRRVVVPFKFVAPITQQLNARFKRKLFQEVPERVLSQKEYGRLKAKIPPKPVYPPAAKGAQATVQVKFVVAPDGSTINPEIIGEPPRAFYLPAVMAIAAAKYEPPVKDGKPVYVEMTAKLPFQPPQRAARRGRGGGGGGGGFGGDFGGGGGGGGGGGFGDPF